MAGRVEEVEVEQAVKDWLKSCAEQAGLKVVGMPTLTPLAGNQSGFGQAPIKYIAAITVLGGDETASNISEAMLKIPPEGFTRATGSAEDKTTFHFRLTVER